MFGLDKLNQPSSRLKIFPHEVGIHDLDTEARFDKTINGHMFSESMAPPSESSRGLVQCRQWLLILRKDLSADVVSQYLMHLHEQLAPFGPAH
jgi:hypothetical protein